MSEPRKPSLDHAFSTKELADQLSPHIEQFLRIHWPAISAFVTQVVPQIAEIIVNIPKSWAAYSARIDALTAESKQAMQLALNKGWFLGWITTLEDVSSLVDGIKSLQPDQLDDYLSAYFRENFDYFISQLAERYPDRGQAIRAAARAHKEFGHEGFYLSIPVFIAQADGISAQILNVKMPFSGTNASSSLKDLIQEDQKSLDLLQPIFAIHQSDFLKTSKNRGGVFNALNRHQVMHGESSSYASEQNSLKALSFLAFVGLHMADFIPRSAAE